VKVFSISADQFSDILAECTEVIGKQLRENKEKSEWDGIPEKFIIFSQFTSRFFK